jgi:serine/threonine protein kinase
LLLTPSLPSAIKIIDFGSALPPTISQNHFQSDSYSFLSPEAANGHFSEKSDIWSAGLILHFLISGTLPKRNEKGEIRNDWETAEEFQGVSAECVNLIKSMLKNNPEERPSAENALKSGWIQRGDKKELSTTSLLKSAEKIKQTRVFFYLFFFFIILLFCFI